MNQFTFSKNDIDQIKKNGQTLDEIYSHLLIFEQGTPFVNLDRPCTVGDGIRKLPSELIEQCIYLHECQGVKKKLIKFVPASGAATRMFKKLINAYQAMQTGGPRPEGTASDDISFFLNNCRRFAFYDDLKASLLEAGLPIAPLLAAQDSEKILKHLLTENYLNYALLPKGLIKFHSYGSYSRTAFEEHFVEAAEYARTDADECALHFTVAPRYREKFFSFFKEIQAAYEDQCGTSFRISFSVQEARTNTLAVDMQNRPFRISDGSLLFRPGGHGALINNLNQLDADIVFIKNIDNIAHERFIPEMIQWKKILCGYLINLQDRIFLFLNQLHQQPADSTLTREITGFLSRELSVQLPQDFMAAADEQKQKILINLLDRPLRVCGMVPNTGDPGGGPFWTKSPDNRISIQIIEASQIDMNNDRQKSILKQLTHFNPVDLVCGIKNWRGELFDLSKYVDHQAVFISNKSENGRDLKALELPGLWNGAMAFWNTVFVEVPKISFNPVKEVNDLLEPHHQPES